MVAAVIDMNALELEDRGHHTPTGKWKAVLERHGFGEAWFLDRHVFTVGEMLVMLRLENTEDPTFLLLRRRNNHMSADEPDYLWHLYGWV